MKYTLGKETSLYSLEKQNKQTKGLFLLFAVKITSRVDHPDLWWHILFHFVEFVIILKEKHFNYLGRIQRRTLKNVIHTRSLSDIIGVIWLTFSIVAMSRWHTHKCITIMVWIFQISTKKLFPTVLFMSQKFHRCSRGSNNFLCISGEKSCKRGEWFCFSVSKSHRRLLTVVR